MTLDRIAIDLSGMTGPQWIGNAEAAGNRAGIGDFDDPHGEPVGAHMIDPGAAAAAGWRLVDDEFGEARRSRGFARLVGRRFLGASRTGGKCEGDSR